MRIKSGIFFLSCCMLLTVIGLSQLNLGVIVASSAATITSSSSSDVPTVFIVITVKTSYHIVKDCLDSLARHRPPKLILQQKIVLVDDGSPPQTLAFEKELCSQRKSAEEFHCLQTEDGSRGYTFAINKGIKYSLSLGNSNTDAILLLNSDVIVTFGWLQKLYQSLYSDEKMMIVGPVSNAATFQSIPHTNIPGHGWSTNPLPNGLNVDYLGYLVSIATPSQHNQDWPPIIPSTPVKLTILNGFCYLMKASVFSKVGYFNDVAFPAGYGEEVDYSLRVQNAGYLAQFIPSVFIYHHKTASFSMTSRNELKAQANKVLRKMHGPELVKFGKTSEECRKQVSYLEEQIGNVYFVYQKRFTITPSKSSEKLSNRLMPQLTATAALTSTSAVVSRAITALNSSPQENPPQVKPPYRALYIMGLSSSEYRTQLKWKSSLLRLLTSIKESGPEISILDRPILFENMSDPRGTPGQFYPNGIPQIHHTSIKPETLNSMFVKLHSDLFNLDRFSSSSSSSSRAPEAPLHSSIQRFLSYDVITSDSCAVILFVNRLLSLIQQLPSFRESRLPALLLYSGSSFPFPGDEFSSVPRRQSPNLEKIKSALLEQDRDVSLRQCYEKVMTIPQKRDRDRAKQREGEGERESSLLTPYVVSDSVWSTNLLRQFFQQVIPSQDHSTLASHLITIPTPVDHLKYFWDQTQMYSRFAKMSSSSSLSPSLSPIATVLSGGLKTTDLKTKRSRPYRALLNLNHSGSIHNIEFIVDLIFLLLEKAAHHLSLTVLGSKTLLTEAYTAIVLDRSQAAGTAEYLPPKHFKLNRLDSKYIDFVASKPSHSPISIQANTTLPQPPPQQEILSGYPELLRRHDFFLDLSLSHSSSQDLFEMMAAGCVPIIPLTSPLVCHTPAAGTSTSSPFCLQFDTSDVKRYSESLLSLIGVNHPIKASSDSEGYAVSLSPSLLPELVIQGYKQSIPLSIELSAASLSMELNKISRYRKK